MIGIDYSIDPISYAQNNLEKSLYKDLIEYSQADFFNIPYSNETFDFVFCSNSLMYLTDLKKKKLINEQKRVVKKSGRITSKEYDGETIILYPIPPELWLKLKNAIA
ncbi:MAG: class I SAM-dependent methyltransferase [Aetokthonos hydrillicola CCALA 1050]|nr:class I SAM-dependent methyltransferase [Aetokthonos hydrillicola CCALA 1050]MBW4585197.1 class I SAM-dependent methyltransferase [Aetokthonos hydrillicola CCALA 1050]